MNRPPVAGDEPRVLQWGVNPEQSEGFYAPTYFQSPRFNVAAATLTALIPEGDFTRQDLTWPSATKFMLPDSTEIKQYTFSRSAPPPVKPAERPMYRMNVLERGWDRLGGLDWSKKAVILSALVSVLSTAIAFGFFASLIFIPKYFTLSGDLARLAQVEKDMAALKASQDEFQQQTLAQSLRLNEQLRDQGLKIESVGETAEAARRTVETKIETERRLKEEQEKAEQERQLALARQQAQQKTTPSSPNTTPSPTGGPSDATSYSPPPPSPQSHPSPTVPSLINPEAGSSSQGSGAGSFFSDLAKAIGSLFGALFGQVNNLDGQK